MPNKNPIPGEKHYTSSIFLVSQEKPSRILLVHHKKIDKWLPPGGHQELNETAIDTAIREAKEETGIDITNFIPSPLSLDNRVKKIPIPQFILEEKIDSHGDQPEHYHLDMIYVVHIPQQSAVAQEDESHAIGWFTEEEINSLQTFENVSNLTKELLHESQV